MEYRIGPEAGLTLLGYDKNLYLNIIFYDEIFLKNIPVILDVEILTWNDTK